ncbi:TrbM/KikA/MpfK family conjugal transfer protein [Caballeronia zhejiangensis]|uniref:TrbM/KikA/MpfK family conjugal transfer protein n=1 Tax=Caballeronia zhejiangensis TaxID=871203 RepID=UPI00158A3AEA|nr:killer protein [Caballeronia zhejiangensis]
MSRYMVANFAAIAVFSTSSVAFAKDPCQSLICMVGKVQGGIAGNGSSGDGCSQGINDFLSIVRTHHGHMDLTATPNARRDYLNSCPGAAADAPAVESVISKFGNATL